MKKHFQVLLLPQEYLIATQVQLVSALVVVHYFIHLFDPRDKELNDKQIPQETSENSMMDTECVGLADDRGNTLRCREEITQVIWRDYEARSCRR
jgi:hypothetical protein